MIPPPAAGTAAVVVNGEPVLSLAAGCAPDTRFQASSTSKQFAAAAVLLLVDRGVLDLSAPITRWLPDPPPVSLHALLTHTAGIPHWDGGPATGPHYSSPGYLLVGRVVARAAGQPYADFLRAEVFAPLGLAHTTSGPADDVLPGDARPWDLAALAGAGDIAATALDLARFTHALHAGPLLSASSKALLVHPHVAITPELSYGYAHLVGETHFHPGDNPGYRSLTIWDPRTATATALLANRGGADLDTTAGILLGPAHRSTTGARSHSTG